MKSVTVGSVRCVGNVYTVFPVGVMRRRQSSANKLKGRTAGGFGQADDTKKNASEKFDRELQSSYRTAKRFLCLAQSTILAYSPPRRPIPSERRKYTQKEDRAHHALGSSRNVVRGDLTFGGEIPRLGVPTEGTRASNTSPTRPNFEATAEVGELSVQNDDPEKEFRRICDSQHDRFDPLRLRRRHYSIVGTWIARMPLAGQAFAFWRQTAVPPPRLMLALQLSADSVGCPRRQTGFSIWTKNLVRTAASSGIASQNRLAYRLVADGLCPLF
ncbi:hypothetical protein BDZ89DRAFT_1120592, partial [Hymenopellis radicata]